MKKNRRVGQRIKLFRENHYPSQKALAEALGLVQTVVSAWERGDNIPSSEAWVKLGNLAPYPDNLWFWAQAGMDEQAILSAAEKLLKDRVKDPGSLVEKGSVVLVPRFRETLQGREEAGSPVPLPAEFIPNQNSTICVLIDEAARGIVNAPRGTFIVDTSVEEAQELTDLWGKAVLLDFQLEDRSFPKGIYAGRLLLSEHVFYTGRAGGLTKQAHLDMLTRGAFASLPLGEWRHPSFDELRFQAIVGSDGVGRSRPPTLEEVDVIERLQRETEDRAPVEFRLPKGIRILGQLIGRLSGNVK
jgi:transcriptional regulator with XRE-family HTH domain